MLLIRPLHWCQDTKVMKGNGGGGGGGVWGRRQKMDRVQVVSEVV